MKLTGRRESSHVDDRRRSGGGKKAGMGIGGLVVAALVVWLMGGNPLSVLTQADLGSMITQQSGGTYEPTAEEEALAKFSSQILAGTEDVWAKEFKKMGKTYQPPRLVLFTGNQAVVVPVLPWGHSIVRPTRACTSTCPSLHR